MQQQQTNQAIPDNLLPSHTFQFLLGDLKAFRGQTRYIFFQCVLGLSVGRAHQTSTGRRPGGILTRPKPPQPVSWNTHVTQSTGSAPQSLLRSELLSLSLRLISVTQWRKLNPQSYSFNHYPYFMTTAEGWISQHSRSLQAPLLLTQHQLTFHLPVIPA